MTAAILP